MMKKLMLASALAILLLSAALPVLAETYSYEPAADQMRINVGFRAAQMEDVAGRIIETYGGVLLSRNAPILGRTYLIPKKEFGRITSDGDLLEMTKYIAEDQKCYAEFIPNDPSWNLQWGPSCIDAPAAWDQQRGSQSVILAIIDTGVQLNHPDLAANIDTNIDYDFVNNDAVADDDYGHGTHVAGIAAAVINNGIGVAGISQSKIMAVKVLNSQGWGYWSWVASGITYAADNGAKVLNMSLGGTSNDPSVAAACTYAYNTKDGIVVASAGNSGSSVRNYPAAYPEVIGVAALAEGCNSRAGYSNYGADNVELSAPGSHVYSTYFRSGYTYMDGTSMASPHVAGVAALWRAERPNESAPRIRAGLRRYADDLGDPGYDIYYGYGRVDAQPFNF
jgi:subtilisin family serine protease